MSIDLCRPCAIEMERLLKDGVKLVAVKSGVNRKVTCESCQRRRYGATYEKMQSKSKAKA